jgi:hypothetical protein
LYFNITKYHCAALGSVTMSRALKIIFTLHCYFTKTSQKFNYITTLREISCCKVDARISFQFTLALVWHIQLSYKVGSIHTFQLEGSGFRHALHSILALTQITFEEKNRSSSDRIHNILTTITMTYSNNRRLVSTQELL